MRGITVCCEGEKTLNQELKKLNLQGRIKPKKQKNRLLEALKLFTISLESKLDLQRR